MWQLRPRSPIATIWSRLPQEIDIAGLTVKGKDHQRVIRRTHGETKLFIGPRGKTMRDPASPSTVRSSLLDMIGSISIQREEG